jgi:3-deoxy-D-manno-octulosonic-acid transferase
LAGLFAVTNKNECSQIIKKLVEDNHYRTKTGMICGHYIKSNTGATQKTMDYILNLYDNSRS